MLHVLGHGRVAIFAPNETFSVKDCVGWVEGDLVLGGVANESFGVVKGNVGGSCAVALVVGDNLDFAVLEHPHARVGGAQVDAHCRCHHASIKMLAWFNTFSKTWR